MQFEHAKQLRELGRQLPDSLQLPSLNIEITQSLRHLPRRRLAAIGSWQGKPAFIKLFFDKRLARKEFLRETTMAQELARFAIRSPEVLAGGAIPGGGYWFVMQLLQAPSSLKEAWQDCPDPQSKDEKAGQLMSLLETLYKAGLRQDDAHLGNFAFEGNRLYLLDPGGVRRNRLFGKRKTGNNLALLIAQFPWPDHKLLIERAAPLFQSYCPGGEALEPAVKMAWRKRIRKLSDKMLRASSWVARWRNGSIRTFARRSRLSPELRSLTMDAASLNKAIDNGTILKRGNSATVARIQLGDRAVIIKRYNLKNTWVACKRAFGKSRAKTSWLAAHKLEYSGLATALPVAMIEERRWGLLRRSWFLTEEVCGEDAWHLFRQREPNNEELQQIETLFSGLVYTQLSHGDMKATNFLVAASGVALIDLDACEQHRNTLSFKKAFRRDLKRFNENWQDENSVMQQFEKITRRLLCKLEEA
jgi:tRNA A-37 threonylcarbamoyl transferase component Bud32